MTDRVKQLLVFIIYSRADLISIFGQSRTSEYASLFEMACTDTRENCPFILEFLSSMTEQLWWIDARVSLIDKRLDLLGV